MKLTTVAVFGAGYLLGARAGRERYEQLCELASGRFAGSRARRRLAEYGAQLGAYAAQSRAAQSRAAQPETGRPGAGPSGGGAARPGRAGAGSGGRPRS